MNRRFAIKQFIVFSAGVALLPSCLSEKKKVSAYNNLPVYEDDETLLAAVAETILPSSKTPGAKEIQSHLFALQMMNDCYEAGARENFLKQMKAFDNAAKKKYNTSFIKCTPQQQQEFVGNINNEKDAKDDVAGFYNTYKGLVLQSYTSSKYFLTNVDVYKLVPGKFISSVHVNA